MNMGSTTTGVVEGGVFKLHLAALPSKLPIRAPPIYFSSDSGQHLAPETGTPFSSYSIALPSRCQKKRSVRSPIEERLIMAIPWEDGTYCDR